MRGREFFGCFHHVRASHTLHGFAGGPTASHRRRPIGSRRLRFEPLEDRHLLSVMINLLSTADTGRSNHDNITKAAGHNDIVVAAGSTNGADLSISDIGIDVDGKVHITAAVGPDGTIWENYIDEEPQPWNSSLLEGEHVVVAVVTYEQVSISIPPSVTDYTLSAQLEIIVDSTAPAAPTDLDLIDSSDSGKDHQDNVTNINQPAFNGKGEPEAMVRLYARRLVGSAYGSPFCVGEGLVGGSAEWSLATSALADGTYHIYATQEDVAGNISTESLGEMITIDTSGRPEPYGAQYGVWAAGSAYLDLNGNCVFDPENADPDYRDAVYTIGFSTDVPFTGDFCESATGQTDRYDKLAVYGRTSAGYRWLIDFTNDGVPDETFNEPAGFQNIGVPVAGNFDGIDKNGQEVGVFTGSVWRFDTDHDFLLADEKALASDLHGLPVVGDFDGDSWRTGDPEIGQDLATWDPLNNRFMLSLSAYGGGVDQALATGRVVLTHTFRLGSGYAFNGARERPVAADMDKDGIDDLGLWVADRSGMTPDTEAEWYILASDHRSIVERMTTDPLNPKGKVVQFCPAPAGADLFARFGDEFGVPLLGKFCSATGLLLQSVAMANAQAVRVATQQPDNGETEQSAVVVDTAEPTLADTQQSSTLAAQPTTTATETEETTPAVNEETATVAATQPDEQSAPEVVHLQGTAEDDLVVVMPASGVVQVNGVSQQFQGEAVNIEFDGLAGNDTVTISGTSADETAELWPDHSVFTSQSLSVTAANVESTMVVGGGGSDTATFHDSAGNDQFVAAPDAATLQGDGFLTQALGFCTVNAFARQGGSDVAKLYDSAQTDSPDHLEAKIDSDGNWVRVSNALLDYAAWAVDFELVEATSSNPQDTKDVESAVQFLLTHGYW